MNSLGIEELNQRMEEARREMESYEEEPSKREEEWKKTLDSLIQINNEVTRQGIFSENEQFSEIKPEDIKFLLIPYFQAELIQKFMENRDSKLLLALRFYEEFYKRLNKYEYLSKEKKQSYKSLVNPENDEKNKKPSMEQMNKERTEKIQMFKYKKALSEKIKKKFEKEKEYDNIRDYWISYMELCWIKMLESIKMIKLEGESIKYLKENKDNIENQQTSSAANININNVKKGIELLKITPDNFKTIDPNNKLLRNIEIKSTHNNCVECMNGTHTKNVGGTDVNSIVENYTNVRDKVFRPSNMPTLTLDEFAEREMARAKEQEEKQKQFQMEKPDSDSEDEKVSDRKTYEARSWDDWKDDHPKGSGNRKK